MTQALSSRQERAAIRSRFALGEGINQEGKMLCHAVTQQKTLLAWKQLEDSRNRAVSQENLGFGLLPHPSFPPLCSNLSIWVHSACFYRDTSCLLV